MLLAIGSVFITAEVRREPFKSGKCSSTLDLSNIVLWKVFVNTRSIQHRVVESVRQHSIYPTSCCISLSCHALARLQHELQCNTSHTHENAVHAHGAYLSIFFSGILPESLRPLRVESQCSLTISLSFLMMHFPFLRFKRPKHQPCRKSKCLECTWHLPKSSLL